MFSRSNTHSGSMVQSNLIRSGPLVFFQGIPCSSAWQGGYHISKKTHSTIGVVFYVWAELHHVITLITGLLVLLTRGIEYRKRNRQLEEQEHWTHWNCILACCAPLFIGWVLKGTEEEMHLVVATKYLSVELYSHLCQGLWVLKLGHPSMQWLYW